MHGFDCLYNIEKLVKIGFRPILTQDNNGLLAPTGFLWSLYRIQNPHVTLRVI